MITNQFLIYDYRLRSLFADARILPMRITFLVTFALLAVAQSARCSILQSYSFDDITSATISTTQYQTGNWLVYSADFADWNKSGFNATHAIQLSGAIHGGVGDYAIMIYGDNVLTQETAFAANDQGTTYYVSYDIGPTVYTEPSQATQAGDTFLLELLRNDNSVFSSNYVAPGAWSGAQTFAQTYFSYQGDGSGDLRIRLSSGNTQTRFAGAINNVAFWDSQPVPEPSTYALFGLGAIVLVIAARRRHSA